MFTYRVQYIANDGKPCAFKFKSETVLRNTFNCYCKLHMEMWEAAKNSWQTQTALWQSMEASMVGMGFAGLKTPTQDM